MRTAQWLLIFARGAVILRLEMTRIEKECGVGSEMMARRGAKSEIRDVFTSQNAFSSDGDPQSERKEVTGGDAARKGTPGRRFPFVLL